MSQTDFDPDKVIAVVGASGIFPGCKNIDVFWDFLVEGKCAIKEMPPSRGFYQRYVPKPSAKPGDIYTKYAATINLIEYFDSDFFSLNKNQTLSIDPQARMLLQASWHALENANIPPHTLDGTNTGIFIGKSSSDYNFLLLNNIKDENIDSYLAANTISSSVAGRLSYFYNTIGTAFVIDTETSSSLSAIHEAVINLQAGRCDMAIVGAVNVILALKTFQLRCASRMITPDTVSHIFDERANGYTRGEGVGVTILKRFSDAIRDGDVPKALILGGAINECGHAGSYAVPNLDSQISLVNTAMENAQVGIDDIDYYEAHGTGTRLGDEVEIKALQNIFKKRKNPLLLGSVKSNIGHLEAAAGFAGFIKVLLCLKYKTIPPHINCEQPLKGISDIPGILPNTLVPLEEKGSPRTAAVTSLGLTGTNVCLVVQEYDEKNRKINRSYNRKYHLLTLSAKSKNALHDMVSSYAQMLREQKIEYLEDLCITTNNCRTHHECRFVAKGDSIEAIQEQLDIYLEKTEKKDNEDEVAVDQFNVGYILAGSEIINFRKIVQLYKMSNVFKLSLAEITYHFDSYLQCSLIKEIFKNENNGHDIGALANPIAFCVDYALARFWMALGITPACLIGFGVGELAAACISGNLSVKDAAKFVSEIFVKSIEEKYQSLVNSIEFMPLKYDTIFPSSHEKFRIGTVISAREWLAKTSDFKQSFKKINLEDAAHCRGYLLMGSQTESIKDYIIDNEVCIKSIFDDENDIWDDIMTILAKFYRGGGEINWTVVNQQESYIKARLPFYPFQLKPYWHPDIPNFTEVNVAAISEKIEEKGNQPSENDLLITLSGMTKNLLSRHVKDYIHKEMRNLLNLSDSYAFSDDDGFLSMGFDSLTVIEFRNRIEKYFDHMVKSGDTLLFDNPNVNRLTDYITDIVYNALHISEKIKPEVPVVEPIKESPSTTLPDKEKPKDESEPMSVDSMMKYILSRQEKFGQKDNE